MRLRPYPLLLGLILFGCVLAYFPSWLMLERSRENSELSQLVVDQMASDGLYQGSFYSPADYKIQAYSRLQPEVVILGSSRAMRWRRQFFTVPSYSMGGLVYTPALANALMEKLISVHKPRAVIYNMDFWSFCARGEPKPPPPSGTHRPRPALVWPGWPKVVNKFIHFWSYLSTGRVPAQELVDLLEGRYPLRTDGVDFFGNIAMMHHYGFATDGAMTQLVGGSHDGPPPFEKIRQTIREGGDRFWSGCRLDMEAMADLDQLVVDMRRAGVELVLAVPALPPEIMDLLRSTPDRMAYIDEWRREMESRDYPEIHFHLDGRSIGASDAEFGDGFHAGDVAEARMALKIAETPHSALAPLLDRAVLGDIVTRYAGRTALGWRELRAYERGEHTAKRL